MDLILTFLRRPAISLGAGAAHQHRPLGVAQAVGLQEGLYGLLVVDMIAFRQGEEVRFATDSPLEGGGFEPSVPQQIRSLGDRTRQIKHRTRRLAAILIHAGFPPLHPSLGKQNRQPSASRSSVMAVVPGGSGGPSIVAKMKRPTKNLSSTAPVLIRSGQARHHRIQHRAVERWASGHRGAHARIRGCYSPIGTCRSCCHNRLRPLDKPRPSRRPCQGGMHVARCGGARAGSQLLTMTKIGSG